MAEYTPESFAALEAALANALVKHQEAQKEIGIVTDGDTNVWHDNFAFDDANRQEQRWRIEVAKLKSLVADAVVVQKTGEHDHVQVGTHVTVRLGDDEETFVIAGEQNLSRWSEDGHSWLSQSSPLGSALMEHVAGDTVTYMLPSGASMDVEILKIR